MSEKELDITTGEDWRGYATRDSCQVVLSWPSFQTQPCRKRAYPNKSKYRNQATLRLTYHIRLCLSWHQHICEYLFGREILFSFKPTQNGSDGGAQSNLPRCSARRRRPSREPENCPTMHGIID